MIFSLITAHHFKKMLNFVKTKKPFINLTNYEK